MNINTQIMYVNMQLINVLQVFHHQEEREKQYIKFISKFRVIIIT